MNKKITFEFKVGEIVWDTLTQSKTEVIGISYEHGQKGLRASKIAVNCYGYWVNNDYVGGGRHPWEIGKPLKKGIDE